MKTVTFEISLTFYTSEVSAEQLEKMLDGLLETVNFDDHGVESYNGFHLTYESEDDADTVAARVSSLRHHSATE